MRGGGVAMKSMFHEGSRSVEAAAPMATRGSVTRTTARKKKATTRRKTWVPASVMIERINVYVGSWPSAEEAAIARDRFRLHVGRVQRVRFPQQAHARGPATAAELRREALDLARAGRPTPYTGVRWDAEREQWRADAYKADRSGYDILGYFDDDLEAAVMRDRVMLHVHGDRARSTLNFPDDRLRPFSLARARELTGHRARTDKSSPFLGVNLVKGRWSSAITVDGEHFHLGTFDGERDAARAYDRAALFLRGPRTKLNFPRERSLPTTPEQLRREGRAQSRAGMTSQYLGVSWTESSQAWAAFVSLDGGHVFVGHFQDEKDAALAYDAVARQVYAPTARDRLNFPDLQIAPRSAASVRAERWERFKTTCTSSYTGVCWSKHEEKWRAIISVDGVTHQLGAFENEAEAAQAYDDAAWRLLGPTAHVNFPVAGQPCEPTPRSARRRR